jgi:tetratricopeptide (TPR) repeat protein
MWSPTRLKRDWYRDLANTLSRLGQALAGKGDLECGQEQYRSALKIRSELAVANQQRRCAAVELRRAIAEIARLEVKRGNLDAALAQYRLAIGIREDLHTKDPTNVNWEISLAPLYAEIGALLKRKGDVAGAIDQYRKGYTLRRDIALRTQQTRSGSGTSLPRGMASRICWSRRIKRATSQSSYTAPP